MLEKIDMRSRACMSGCRTGRQRARYPVPVLLVLACANHSLSAAPRSETIGFQLSTWHVAMPEVPDDKECPAGFQTGQVELWRALYPDEERQKGQMGRTSNRQNVGPEGENAWYFPTLVEDPLPFREVQSEQAYGMNLDGTTDGRATSRTCAHKKFTSPDGTRFVDNQLYRVLGCQGLFRKSGFVDDYFLSRIVLKSMNRILIEVSGIDDLSNDDAVTVTLGKGRDKITTDSKGKIIPWTTQRVDERTPQYIHQTEGRIVDGTLITEPVDILLPQHLVSTPSELYIRGMRLRLKLTADGASGLLVGYQDLDQFWTAYSAAMAVGSMVGTASGPATYRALHRHADGYIDPTSGQCTAISAAYSVDFVRSFIVRDERKGAVASTSAMASFFSEVSSQ